MTKLTDVVGIGPVIATLLFDHNIKTVEQLASISMAELLKVPSFNENRARIIIKAAVDCLQNETDLKYATAAANIQTARQKTVGKRTIVSKVPVQPEDEEVKDKKKNKKDDKKKNKKNGKKKNKKKKDKDNGKKGKANGKKKKRKNKS